MKKTLILGCGNIFASDDGVGVRVAERLALKALPAGVEIIKGETAGLFLLDLIRGAEKIIIIDAILGDMEVGTVTRLTEEDLLWNKDALRSTHHLGICEALNLGRITEPGSFPEEVVIVGIQIQEQKELGFGLSPAVEAAVEEAVAAVEREF